MKIQQIGLPALNGRGTKGEGGTGKNIGPRACQ
jgi:hypothetical protein